MKSEKGITLISLIIYVIVMLIVVTTIGTVTSYFYANVKKEYNEEQMQNSESNLNLYLINDLKNKKIRIYDVLSNEIQTDSASLTTIRLVYDDSSIIQYTIKEDGIYRDALKIYDKENNEMTFEIVEVVENEKLELRINQENGTNPFKSYIVNIRNRYCRQSCYFKLKENENKLLKNNGNCKKIYNFYSK